MVNEAPRGTRMYVQHHGNMHMDARRMAGVPAYFQRASDRVPRDLWLPCPCLTFLIRHRQATSCLTSDAARTGRKVGRRRA